MAEKAKAIPDGFHTVTPHLTVHDAKRALEFYQKAFGAQVLHVSNAPNGKVMHASIRIGDSPVMLNDEFPEFGSGPVTPETGGVTLHLYFEDVDSAFQRAVSAGAAVKMPLADQFWGDRYGQVMDPFGYRWSLGAHVRDVSPEEVEKAIEEMTPPQMPKSA